MIIVEVKIFSLRFFFDTLKGIIEVFDPNSRFLFSII